MERPKNPLLLPKWKKRTVDTHLEHIKLYDGKEYQFAFLGDSMMERWFRTGANIWNKHFDKRVCNLGVGGDGVQNLLLRLQGFEQDQEHVKGIFDFVNITNTVFLMIGTNNAEHKHLWQVIDGIKNVIEVVQTKIKCKLVIFGLPYRKDVSFDVINNINKQIEEFCLFKNLEFVKTSHLFDINRDYDDHVHLSQTGYEKWYKLFQERMKE